jgi:hypothetical protein
VLPAVAVLKHLSVCTLFVLRTGYLVCMGASCDVLFWHFLCPSFNKILSFAGAKKIFLISHQIN